MPMFDSDYSLAWTLYGIAALGCLLFWFRVTRWMWRWLREPLRLIVAVLLFTPTIVDPAKELFAPAVAITAMDLAFKVGNNAWRAVADLAMYGMIAFGLYLLLVAIRWPIERKYGRRSENQAADEDSRTLRERMEDQDDDDYERDYAPSRGQMRTEPRL
ncbi:MFS transporter [Pseudomonas stutzeri]|uniref:MFS transporter n=1 Tax=Stutzerimonas stutzeri TaxID=316 RepID=A0A2N8S7I3_STUST|nr:MFS transporter [Stutzerimonas stutzeri]MCQ4294900.1 MFS transporter [Stutzerimonas stutzeri]PNF82580.1 MFS transporter [Stutzerimonas stutzeri]